MIWFEKYDYKHALDESDFKQAGFLGMDLDLGRLIEVDDGYV
jgi:hypothetical protein